MTGEYYWQRTVELRCWNGWSTCMGRRERGPRRSQTRSRRILSPPSGSGRRRKQIKYTPWTGRNCLFVLLKWITIFFIQPRFNPLFEEEAVIETNLSKDVIDDQETISTTSSGYGSNTTHKGKLISFFLTKNEGFFTKRIYGNKIVYDSLGILNWILESSVWGKEDKMCQI